MVIVGNDISARKKTYRTPTADNFPEEVLVKLKRDYSLQYGENPPQGGAIYSLVSINEKDASTVPRELNIESVRSDGRGKGGLSLTNTIIIIKVTQIPNV